MTYRRMHFVLVFVLCAVLGWRLGRDADEVIAIDADDPPAAPPQFWKSTTVDNWSTWTTTQIPQSRFDNVDIDDDGDLDIVTTEWSGAIVWYANPQPGVHKTMIEIIAALVSLFVSPANADALRSTAPRYLDVDRARDNIAGSVVAGIVTRFDPGLLLSIAHHESHYSHTEVTNEPEGGVSCGVMTPEPTTSRRACSDATRSIVAGYMAGARHLRGWVDACARLGRHDERCALLGYAGGFRLIAACTPKPTVPGCYIPSDFKQRAETINRALRRAQETERE